MTLPEILFILFVIVFVIGGIYKSTQAHKKALQQRDEMVARIKNRQVLVWLEETDKKRVINIGDLPPEEWEEIMGELTKFIKDKKKVKNEE